MTNAKKERKTIEWERLEISSDIIKDRSSRNLTEAEDIKKRWQEYTEELYKKIFTTQITMMV